MTTTRWIIRSVGIVALLALLVVILLGPPEGPVPVGSIAPRVVGRTLDGAAFDLQQLRGRFVVVNIWATWCVPCRAELPGFVASAQRHPAVAFVGLAADSPLVDVVNMSERFAIPYPVVPLAGRQLLGWNASALPSTYLIDPEGRVAWSVRGAIDEHTLDEVVQTHAVVRASGVP